ncbi:MAG: 3-oxoacyl-[acyl-carrier-protein] reductase [Deltaproteobacteria bacterium]|nr:3-oxoacyl-[acyl-carrier-protein] reductase [Deltaproteobacteria bacterium]
MRLEDKIALITGGSRGIGRATALRLAREGAFVYINFLTNETAAIDTLKAVEETGGNGKILQCDVSDFQAVQTMIKAVINEKGKLDILINNAGMTIDGLMARTKESDWDRMINTNLKGVFNCCQAVTRQMMRQRKGRIINITSVVAQAGNAGQTGYASSKAGIIGLTKSLAKELGSRNICINAVAPGFIDTDMTQMLAPADKQMVRDQIPLGRLGKPEDVAAVVAFLASEDASYLTGQVLGVNGGLYM